MRHLGATCAPAITVLLLVPLLADAQGKRKLADQVKELSGKVDSALKAAAEGSTAAKALQDLAAQVSALQRKVAGLEQSGAAVAATRSRLEQYEARMGNLELDLAGLKMQAAESAAGSGFNKGFFVQSADGKFKLRVGGLLQLGYEGRIFAGENLGSDLVAGKDESTFLLKRARLSASGHLLSWRLSYRLELEFGSEDRRLEFGSEDPRPGLPGGGDADRETGFGPLLEGWSEVHLHKALRLRAGRQKVPFGRQFIIHSAYQQFTERSGATRSFAQGWDLGAVLLGNIPFAGVISYQMGIFNGAGAAERDENTDFLYAARLLYQPLGPLSYAEGDTRVGKLQIAVGGALTYNLVHTDMVKRKRVTDPATGEVIPDSGLNGKSDIDQDGQIDNVGVLQMGAELVARLGGLAWQSELFYREEDPGAVSDKRKFWGAYSQASFFHFSSSLEIACRYAYWEPSYYGQYRDRVLPTRIQEVAAAVNGLVWRQRINWQVEYAHSWLFDLKREEADVAGEPRVHAVRIQAQLSF